MTRPLVASCVDLELRSLRSTGVTRFHHYYEPLRHLGCRPGRSLTGVRLQVTSPHRRGFPCCVGHPFRCMPTPLPRRNREVRASFSFPRGGWPSRSMGSVGFRVFRFEACSAFTARFGLHHRQVAKRPSTPKTPTDSSPPLPLRLLTGQNDPRRAGFPPARLPTPFQGVPKLPRIASSRGDSAGRPAPRRPLL